MNHAGRADGRRRGMTSVVALVALFVILLIGGALLKLSQGRRTNLRLEERSLQAELLAESGIELGWAKLRQKADYPGETWKIAAGELGGRGAGVVSIRVEPVPNQPERRRIVATADYPAESEFRTRMTRESIITLPQTTR